MPCVLLTDSEIELSELGPGAWTSFGEGAWRMPAELNPRAFLESRAHDQGSYLIYMAPAVVNPASFAHFTWWGPRRAGDSLVAGLHALGVEAVVAVHADASDWLTVLT